jgi:Secretion system C-terminal sorting domain
LKFYNFLGLNIFSNIFKTQKMNFFISKHRIKSLIVLLIGSMHFMASGQITVSLTEVAEQSTLGQQCYHIVLANQGKSDILLAGQNYRLYYDSEISMLSEASLKTLLPEQYTSMDLVQHYFDVDASGFGVLPYDAHLGFINIATDLNLAASGGVSIPVGKSQSVASMCFEIQEGKTPVFTWAQDQLTHTYATAFVEIAMLDGDKLKKSNIAEYRITQNKNTNTQLADVLNLKYFPNPFTDKLNITFNESISSDATVTIKDVFGKEITRSKVQKGSTAFILQGEGLPNGAMFIEIKTLDGQVSVMKAIKVN